MAQNMRTQPLIMAAVKEKKPDNHDLIIPNNGKSGCCNRILKKLPHSLKTSRKFLHSKVS